MIKILPFIFIVLWSSAFITTKPLIDNSDPFTALTFRFFIVSTGFYFYSIFTKQKILVNKKNLGVGISRNKAIKLSSKRCGSVGMYENKIYQGVPGFLAIQKTQINA